MATSREKKIEICKIENEFHWKPFTHEYPTRKVPVWLFDQYVEARAKFQDIKQELESYFTEPIKVNEGEVHKL